jgi:hypothetical protein
MAAWLQKAGWFQQGDASFYQEHLPQVLYTMAEWIFGERPGES